MVGSIDGLASGLNTGQIISQLMSIERQGQNRLRTTQTQTESAIGALRSLNTRFLAIKGIANTFTPPTGNGGFSHMSTVSSDPTRATTTTKPGAAAGEVNFKVNLLATHTIHRSERTVASTSTKVAQTNFVLTKDGTATTIGIGDGTLSGLVAAINAAGAGVSASAVEVSPGAFGLQITSTTSGPSVLKFEGSFLNGTLDKVSRVVEGKAGEVQVGVAADGSGGYKIVTNSNTLDNLLAGTSIKLLKQDATVVTVRTFADNAAVADDVGKLVTEVNAALAELRRTGAYDPTTKTAGLLQGEGAVRSLANRLTAAVTGNRTSSSGMLGISVQRDGTVLLDRDKLLKELEADPTRVQAWLGKDGLGGRLAAVAQSASAPTGSTGGAGLITTAISNRERTVTRIESDIRQWDRRLDLRQERLTAQFTSLEKALGAAQSQGQWLAGQLAGLSRS